MRLRIRKNEAELISAVLRERINLMQHAGVSYNGQLRYRIVNDKICEQLKKQVRGKKVS